MSDNRNYIERRIEELREERDFHQKKADEIFEKLQDMVDELQGIRNHNHRHMLAKNEIWAGSYVLLDPHEFIHSKIIQDLIQTSGTLWEVSPKCAPNHGKKQTFIYLFPAGGKDESLSRVALTLSRVIECRKKWLEEQS